MKTKLTVLLLCVLLGLSGWAMAREGPPEERPPEVQIVKTQELPDYDLRLSNDCKLHEGKAYMSINTFATFLSKDLWLDFKYLENKSIKEIVIYMNNTGGEVHQGLGVADELRIFQQKGVLITIEGRGMIASAAIPVFLMADKRICSKNTIFMIHPSSLFKYMSQETLEDLQSQAEMIQLQRKAYAKIVSDNSILTFEAAMEMQRKDHWFTAQKAKEMGMVDIIE